MWPLCTSLKGLKNNWMHKFEFILDFFFNPNKVKNININPSKLVLEIIEQANMKLLERLSQRSNISHDGNVWPMFNAGSQSANQLI